MITQGQEDGSERWNWHGLRRGRSVWRGDGERITIEHPILRFAKTLISPRLSSWSRRRKQSSKIRKKIQDETKHSFDQWICLKLSDQMFNSSWTWSSDRQNPLLWTSAFGSQLANHHHQTFLVIFIGQSISAWQANRFKIRKCTMYIVHKPLKLFPMVDQWLPSRYALPAWNSYVCLDI